MDYIIRKLKQEEGKVLDTFLYEAIFIPEGVEAPPKVSCILCGLLFIVLGNFMTKTKKNGVAGVRTSWSMYNDVTWRKSNRIGAYCFVIAGILTVITTAFLDGVVSTVLMLIYVLIAAAVAVVYSKKVYEQEKEKNGMG